MARTDTGMDSRNVAFDKDHFANLGGVLDNFCTMNPKNCVLEGGPYTPSGRRVNYSSYWRRYH